MKSIKTEYSNRIEYYNEQGKRHREDGPAIEWNNGDKDWYSLWENHEVSILMEKFIEKMVLLLNGVMVVNPGSHSVTLTK